MKKFLDGPTIVLATVAAAFSALAYLRIDAFLLDFVTAFLFWVALFSTLALLVEIAIRITHPSRSARNNFRTLLVTLALLTLALESFLRFGIKHHETYLERIGHGHYKSPYRGTLPTWYMIHEPDGAYSFPRSEFEYSRTTNSFGLAERDIPLEKDSNEVRILALGDSFTEGVGAAYDSTWVREMERQLRARYPGVKVTAIDAGISGSDPFFEFKLLEDRLVALRPDIVVVVMNESDLLDVQTRGGMARFSEDGTTRFAARPPWWEWAYGMSYIVRSVVFDILGYDWRFMNDSNASRIHTEVKDLILEAVSSFAELERTSGFRLLVITNPNDWEASAGMATEGMAMVIGALESRPDLRFMALHGQYLIDGTVTPENANEFFWPVDGHNNARGYAIMGRTIANEIERLHLVDSTAADWRTR